MNKKSFILGIFLVFIVLIGSSSVFAENSDDNISIDTDSPIVQESKDIEILESDTTSSSTHSISAGSDSETIQNTINNMKDGDVLDFESGTYTDICIYVNKSITINGNGANLVGYDTPSKDNTPEIITKSTNDGGYAIGNLATLYIVKADNVVINGLTITGGANSGATYSNALVYAMNANNLTLKNNVLDGSSWGLYFQFCNDGIVDSNTIKNQATTGFLNFGSARTLIENNKVINAKNHGIDVRFPAGGFTNVTVKGNYITGAKEGIYIMHSAGHTVTENVIDNSIIGITCYGSNNVSCLNNIFTNNTKIGYFLGAGYANISIEETADSFKELFQTKMPPTFPYYIVKSDSAYTQALSGVF
jgi:parallel beta-helix repeat protein